MSVYGAPPQQCGHWQPYARWDEHLAYLYLPVRMPEVRQPDDIRLPRRLDFLYPLLSSIGRNFDPDRYYLYVTARRGFVTPGNPGNRPGWHTDDFGGSDINYIWYDAYPTQFLLTRTAPAISPDDAQSMDQFDALARDAVLGQSGDTRIVEYQPGTLLKLTPYVIHSTPDVRTAGLRSFLKISASEHRYARTGNSHNYLFDYRWPATERQVERNHQSDQALQRAG